AYYDLKKYDLAIADYNKAIALDQNYAHPYYSLGLIAETTGDIQTAIKNYEKAAALYQQQGDDIWYQNAMSNLKRLKGY
ncbi:tetratricopeptide repeat protein, partial [Planktothricoides sp. SR001]|uniref:tetratricopeptide repeat protein n=1 Tax=Planktothricoides sp. SR001 TaxID=1705388 RepID=UPI0012E28ADE